MEKIILASNNEHKVKEFSQIFCEKQILSLKDIDYQEDIEETGNTFFENALLKAKTISNFLRNKGIYAPVISDDSGLCVDALGGEPGIYSARYAGGHGNKEENRKKLLKKLEGIENRKAHFNCTLVKYFPNDSYLVGEGKTYGQITREEFGDKSFGYDCLFLSDDLGKVFGLATSEEKNSVSHRKRAILDLIEKENKKNTN